MKLILFGRAVFIITMNFRDYVQIVAMIYLIIYIKSKISPSI